MISDRKMPITALTHFSLFSKRGLRARGEIRAPQVQRIRTCVVSIRQSNIECDMEQTAFY